MKIVTVLLLSCLLALPTLAAGGGGGGNVDPDQIGIYLDDQAEAFCAEGVPMGFTTTYLVLTNLTSSGILGWEAKVTFTGGGVLTNAVLMGQAINAATRPSEYIVGLATPMMANQGTVSVMTMVLYIFDVTVPTLGFVGPVYYNSIEGVELPCYLDGDDVELIKPLYPVMGDIAEPVLILNDSCTGPVPNETSSWGELKSLYR